MRSVYGQVVAAQNLFITGSPNGSVLFCSLSSVGVVCRRLSSSIIMRCRRAGGWADDTARRASTVTSR